MKKLAADHHHMFDPCMVTNRVEVLACDVAEKASIISLQGDKQGARDYVKRLLQMGVSVGLVTATAIVLGRSWLPQLFSPDPDVIAAAAAALPVVAASMVRLIRPSHSSMLLPPIWHLKIYGTPKWLSKHDMNLGMLDLYLNAPSVLAWQS